MRAFDTTFAALAALAAGCFASAGAPEGVPCGASGECPDGQSCHVGVCSSDEPEDQAPTGPDDPAPRFAPSNDVDPGLLQGATGTLTGDTELDTDTGTIVRGGTILRQPGTGVAAQIAFATTDTLGVFAARDLVVSPGTTLRARGKRALVILLDADAVIDGTLDVSAGLCADGSVDPRCGGPGGGHGGRVAVLASGCAVGGPGDNRGDTGGGGGGFGEAGASGGIELDDGTTSYNAALGGEGGAIENCSSSTLVPLLGGSGGGAGGQDAGSDAGQGGGGGGALQLTAYGAIRVTGTIAAVGAGGRGGDVGGGGGGGSGGAILIEGMVIDLEGIVAATGGGGGEGAGTVAGMPGSLSIAAAQGGTSTGRPGGKGGALQAPTNGATGSNDTGGGGGAAGRIRINARDRLGAPAVVVPVPSNATI